MDLETVTQSEVSQKEKNKYRMLTHIRGPRTQQTLSLRLLGVCLASGPPRVGGGGRPAAALRAPAGA